MRKALLPLLFLTLTSAGFALPNTSGLGGQNQSLLNAQRPDLQINNWVLASPNGDPITVIDLSKRLEVVFRRQFPQYIDVPEARYQYYMANWRIVLDDLIDSALMMSDAEEKKVAVTEGEVRKELEEMFGPNVVETIDTLGLTHDEAWEMVREELTVRRMRGFMVQQRAMQAIGPDQVKNAYEELVAQRDGSDQWEYQFLSIRHRDADKATGAANLAAELMVENPEMSLSQVRSNMLKAQAAGLFDPRVMITLSDMEKRPTKSLAKSHREALTALDPGSFSAPRHQVSRADKSTVFRIFYLADHIDDVPPTFDEMANRLNEQLLGAAAQVEEQRYREKLRNYYGITEDYLAEMIPDEFTPFSLN